MTKCTPWIFAIAVAACGGDRPPPAPPPEPTEPFEDPVTTIGSGGVATTGPIMQDEPALGAKATETVSGHGGTLGTSSGTLGTSNSASTHGHPPNAEQIPIPHGPVGVGGVGATTATLGSTGRPMRGITTDGNIR